MGIAQAFNDYFGPEELGIDEEDEEGGEEAMVEDAGNEAAAAVDIADDGQPQADDDDDFNQMYADPPEEPDYIPNDIDNLNDALDVLDVFDDAEDQLGEEIEASVFVTPRKLYSELPQNDDAAYQDDDAVNHDAERPASPVSDDDEAGEDPAHIDPEDASLDDLRIALEFIDLVSAATLDNDDLDDDTINRLRHPVEGPLEIDDPDFLFAIQVFLATTTGSEDTYRDVRKAIYERYPNSEFLSLEQLKKRIAAITGVTSVTHDMCINSCVGYTGPFKDLTHCPICDTLRYDPLKYNAENNWKRVPRLTFNTIPLGPQLQAMYRSRRGAEAMRYRRIRTQQVLNELAANRGVLDVYDDYITGSEYIEAVRSGNIGDHDIALLLSVDGAQLYEKKMSDCWVYIWVIFEMSPDLRYMKKEVRPAQFVPGPNKPKHFDSFSFPIVHHLSALQREGLGIWDAYDAAVYLSRPFFVIGAADGSGVTNFNGLVGYKGYYSCRLYCPIKGRRIPGDTRYYPVHLKPLDYDVDGCNHDDYDFEVMPTRPRDEYQNNLAYLVESATNQQYERRRLRTGIVKPTLFSGLPPRSRLSIPGCFAADLMHLIALNLTQLLLQLWRGTLVCKRPDNKATWDWAVLQDETWEQHGKTIGDMAPFIPGSFDIAPRNPAERISSGYKAWEFLIYVFVLGPGALYNILPDRYFRNFCKLIAGLRILHQRKIPLQEMLQAHQLVKDFVRDFEELYYQRKVTRIHFCRPSIHGLLHLALETYRLGPCCYYTQWTMERTLGNLTEEIKQPSRPYANLSQRGVRRAQVNALKAMIPNLEPIEPPPSTSLDVGDGYTLLRARDKRPKIIAGAAAAAIRAHLEQHYDIQRPNWSPRVHRWARLRIPNGQIVRTAWKEKLKPAKEVRMSRNIKASLAVT